MNSSPEIEAAAIRLRVAEETGKPCAPVRELFADPNLAAAYAIQGMNREHWLKNGRRIVGRKVALSARAAQKAMGLAEPAWGTLYADMLLGDGDDIFVFATPGGLDRAKDFKVKDDIVALSPDLFGPGWQVGFLDDAQFRKGKAAKTPDEIVIYDKQTGALYVDRDGSGAAVQAQVGILPDHLKLKADDIFIGFFV